MELSKWIKGTALLGTGLLLAACGNGEGTEESADTASENGETAEDTTLVVGASNVPHAEILEFVAPTLEEEGITLEIERYNDYVIPNVALEEGDLDANYFQHGPFFEDAVAENDYDFVNLGGIHIEPIGAYSQRHENIEDLPENATVLVSSNAPDYGRVLDILQEAGLITVEEGVDLTTATFDDIAENPLNLQFEYEYDPALMPTLLEQDEGDVVFINSNFAVDHDLNPLEDAIAIESSSSPYSNIIAVRSEDAEDPALQRLVEVLLSEETQQFILDEWNGSVVPVTE
jgi:D-methionine transport system substrate-binding protein